MKAKRLILVHMYPECQGKEKDAFRSQKFYGGEIILAEHKMEIKV